MQKRFAARGLQVISVSLDQQKEDAGAFARELRTTFPVIFDPNATIATKFGVASLPTNIVIGRDGKVAAVIEGADTRKLDAAVTRALGAR